MYKRQLNDYVDETVEFAQRLVSINPDVRLWFSVPATAMHASVSYTHLDRNSRRSNLFCPPS